MNFGELQTEVYSRGFNYLQSDAAGVVRVKRWINEAYHELCEMDNWPFLVANATGAAPLTVADLRNIESVQDTTAAHLLELDWAPREWLVDAFGVITTAGTPRWYFVDNNVVRVFPVAADNLDVRYFKVPVDLSADGDNPLVPTRWQWLIVEGAVVRGYRDADAWEQAQAAEAGRRQGVEDMRKNLMEQATPSPNLLNIPANK